MQAPPSGSSVSARLPAWRPLVLDDPDRLALSGPAALGGGRDRGGDVGLEFAVDAVPGASRRRRGGR